MEVWGNECSRWMRLSETWGFSGENFWLDWRLGWKFPEIVVLPRRGQLGCSFEFVILWKHLRGWHWCCLFLRWWKCTKNWRKHMKNNNGRPMNGDTIAHIRGWRLNNKRTNFTNTSIYKNISTLCQYFQLRTLDFVSTCFDRTHSRQCLFTIAHVIVCWWLFSYRRWQLGVMYQTSYCFTHGHRLCTLKMGIIFVSSCITSMATEL